jgi:hypothetical protein
MDQPYPEWLRSAQAQAQPGGEHRAAAARSRLSRRSVLRGAAGAGALGLAAAAGAVVATKRQSSPQTISSAGFAEPSAEASAGPLVVYIADVSTGQFDVFAGDGQVRVYNPDLVGQLLANLKRA